MLKKTIITCAALLAVFLLWEVYLISWRSVVVIVDGRRISLHPKPVTVEQLLDELKIKLGKKDIIQPPLTSSVPDKGIIRITRVEEKKIKTEEILPFKVISETSSDTNLRLVKIQRGIDTRILRDVKLLLHDGVEKAREIKKERKTKKAVRRLVLFDEKGGIEKIYDLSKAQKMKMIATAYYPGDPLAWRDGTITFLGEKMQRGVIAVDPNVIPLRTRLYVPGYGYGYAGDTGSAIKGNRVDLGVNNREEEKPWMHKKVTVYILERAKNY
ncbi:MAG: 3D domain-containing protein [Elusimicrobiota bacterium]